MMQETAEAPASPQAEWWDGGFVGKLGHHPKFPGIEIWCFAILLWKYSMIFKTSFSPLIKNKHK